VPVRTLLLTVLVSVAAAPPAAAATHAPRRGALPAPRVADLAYAGTIRTVAATPNALRVLAAGAYWGGTYTANTGEPVTIYASTAYPEDPAVAQKWADFVASLLHGPELASVRMFLEPEEEISRTCGQSALACYDSGSSMLIAPAEDVLDGPTAEAIVAHEYGHHVAAHRANNPWPAVEWGTKRWATYEQVCTRTAKGILSPGNEGDNYSANPGEGFAETYRVLNERRLGLAETPWEIVNRLLYPDDAALAAVERDVTTPWTGTVILRYSGAAKTRTFAISTPLDGTIRAFVRGRYHVDLLTATGARTAFGTTTASSTVCGARTVKVRVTRNATAKAGSFALTVSRP
jgi:hypothetical protein